MEVYNHHSRAVSCVYVFTHRGVCMEVCKQRQHLSNGHTHACTVDAHILARPIPVSARCVCVCVCECVCV